jgi:hypothetical protein
MKTSSCLIKHRVMKTCGKVAVKFHSFLTMTLDVGEWSVSSTCRIVPGEEEDGSLRWLQIWSERLGDEENRYSYHESNPDPSVSNIRLT